MFGNPKPRQKRVQAQAAAEIMRRQHCVYGGKGRCDCKFGVVAIGKSQGSEHGSGCPELSEIVLVLAGLTDAQFVRAHALGTKAALRELKRKDAETLKKVWLIESPWEGVREETATAGTHAEERASIVTAATVHLSGVKSITCASERIAWELLSLLADQRAGEAQKVAEKAKEQINKIDSMYFVTAITGRHRSPIKTKTKKGECK